MNEKPKRDNRSRPPVNRVSFFLLWIILAIGTGAISGMLMPWVINWLLPMLGDIAWQIIILLDGLVFAALTASLQKLLIRWSFGQWIKGWIRASIISSVINVMQFFILQAFSLQTLIRYDVASLPYIMAIAFIAAIPQAWVLRRYVQKSWLYLIAATISSVFPVLLLPHLVNSAFAPSLMMGSSVFLIALVMLWFFRETPEEEKVKRAESMSYRRLEDSSSETEDIQEEEFEARQKRMRFRLKRLFLSWAR